MKNVLGVEAGKRLVENVSSLISFKLCTTYPLDRFIQCLIPFISWQTFHSSFIRRDNLQYTMWPDNWNKPETKSSSFMKNTELNDSFI